MLADRFIGQEAAITQIQTAIDASMGRGVILPHTLLIAPPGVGKTQLAKEISWELGAPYAEIAFPASHKDVIRMLDFCIGILLLDEVHQADRKTLDLLLPFLLTGTIRYGRQEVTNKRLTNIAATTDPQTMPDAFRSRFRLEPRFTEYTTDEIAQIIKEAAQREHYTEIPDDLVNGMAEASLGNPRQGRHLMETYLDLVTVNGEATVEQVLGHIGYSRDGLRPDHLRYLRALKIQGGIASQGTLSQMVHLPAGAMRWIERDLLQRGMIAITNAGRELRVREWDGDEREIVSTETVDRSSDLNPYTLEPR
jgi:Holliday junction DNA helicase RuvB